MEIELTPDDLELNQEYNLTFYSNGIEYDGFKINIKNPIIPLFLLQWLANVSNLLFLTNFSTFTSSFLLHPQPIIYNNIDNYNAHFNGSSFL